MPPAPLYLSAHECLIQLPSLAAALAKEVRLPSLDREKRYGAVARMTRQNAEYLFDNAGERCETSSRDLSSDLLRPQFRSTEESRSPVRRMRP